MFNLLTFDARLLAETAFLVGQDDDGGCLGLETELCLPYDLLVMLLRFLFNYPLFLAVDILGGCETLSGRTRRLT